MTATQDIAALCAAIDAGDDTAVSPLADAMEEAGDPRAAGLRLRHRSELKRSPKGTWYWLPPSWGSDWIPERLRYGHPSRSAAFLALAEALTE